MNSEEMQAAFKKYDQNGDGTIDRDEYIMGCKLNNHCEFSDEDLVKAFAIFDTNGDGQMDNMEFFAAMTYLGLTQNYLSIDTSSIKDKFQDFDQDGDGKICIDEYLSGCRRNGSNVAEETLRKAFKLFDLDSDETIDEKEYNWAMTYLTAVSNLE